MTDETPAARPSGVLEVTPELINHPDLVRITVEGMGRELVEALRGRTDAAPPE